MNIIKYTIKSYQKLYYTFWKLFHAGQGQFNGSRGRVPWHVVWPNMSNLIPNMLCWLMLNFVKTVRLNEIYVGEVIWLLAAV